VELVFVNSYFSEKKFRVLEKCEFNENFKKKKERQLYARSNVYQLRSGAMALQSFIDITDSML
jgi:hypothetical protein